MPTLGPKVYRYDLLWAVWSPRVRSSIQDQYVNVPERAMEAAIRSARHATASARRARERKATWTEIEVAFFRGQKDRINTRILHSGSRPYSR